jgi:hypothetical protein
VGTHRPDPVRTFRVRKPDGRIRVMARLSTRDAAVWNSLAGRVARIVEPRLDPRVLATRAVVTPLGWRQAPLGPALRRARRAAEALAGRGAVLATDVHDFYPSVRSEVLGRSLRHAGADRADARLAEEMLEGWGDGGLRGLPIGPPGSAVLANAVLLPVDRAIGDTPFLRWVDDYLLADPAALPRLDDALRRVGLRRSERKTRTTDPLPWPGGGARYSVTAY